MARNSTELKKAQQHLNEVVIRNFWKKITKKNPHVCISEGISLNYESPINRLHLFRIVDKLTKCSQSKLSVATPLYQYYYDPLNHNPHHISALTLQYNPKTKSYTLNLFNPKGSASIRKKQEQAFLQLLAKLLKTKLKSPIVIRNYTGENLQKSDEIGLCQLYSLYYLNHYIQNPSICTPGEMVRKIKKKEGGGFNENTLLSFWCSFFRNAPVKKRTTLV